ncbi:hypothetical protein BJX68DRAFT_173137 [Aspergillus pseudodeflectus]|uniref:Uncharacterized protein n=1 Tax=Aspergillus pseudodeflectus TaxID=176178 RepID=A0ABR4JMN1_9EURO
MLAIERRNDEVSMALLSRKDINLTIGNDQEQSAVDYALKSGKLKDIGRYQKKNPSFLNLLGLLAVEVFDRYLPEFIMYITLWSGIGLRLACTIRETRALLSDFGEQTGY